MSEAKRLHPISAVMNFLKGLKDAILPAIFLLVLNNDESGTWLDWLPTLVFGVLLVFILVNGFIKWLRFTYRIEEGELRIEYGLIFRKKRYIPIDRIQSLNFSEGVLHRPFNLVKVNIETAGSSDIAQAEADLTAIKKPEAHALEDWIQQAKRKTEADTDSEALESNAHQADEGSVVFRLPSKEIVILAVTSGASGVVFSGLAFFGSQFGEIIPYEALFNEVVEFVQIGVFVVGLASFLLLLISYGIGVLLTFLRFADFKVRLVEDDLIITRGMLEKKQMTIPLNRIQGIQVKQNLLRQPFGYASLHVESAGGGVGDKEEHNMNLLPLVKKDSISGIMAKVLPDYQFDVDLKPAPKRSRFRYFIWNMIITSIIAGAVSWFLWPIGLLSVILVLLAASLSWLQYKDAGWDLQGQQLCLQSRGIIKRTYYMKKYRIQDTEAKQSWFQKRKSLASITSTIKSGLGGASPTVDHLEVSDIETMLQWYEPEKVQKNTKNKPT
ncbi:PH domain-containing protein [Thalassobacillus sp. CUG 92003]|uniref:PH domain-containing protein n=1 Tax=Thalassobacillus sp. CUG 92003 TaxID=2736641 RepID=UPI0015E683D1|nr:PH domain-containing protein [Thalassobacillus sp. CUG 92003]